MKGEHMAAILRVKDENGNIVSIPAIKGDKGEKGDKGDRGLPGSGGVPSGGTTGQILTKNSDEDGDAGWKDNNFVVTESGISEALGYVPRKAWYVNMTIASLKNISSDKTPAEIYQAYTDGYSVYAAIPANFLGSPFILPLFSAFSTNGNYTILFGASADPSNSGTVQFTLVWDKIWYMRYNELIDEQSLQTALSDKLDKNQGTANSGKFLGIGADGIVVPTEVGGSEWTELYNGTIEVPEPVSSLTVDLIKSCEGMTEAVMSFASTKGEGELSGNTSMMCKFGIFGATYGRLGNYSSAQEDKYYFIAPNKNQSMFYKNSPHQVNLHYNTSSCITGWVEPSVISNPNYNQMLIDFWGSPGYQGTITLRIVGR